MTTYILKSDAAAIAAKFADAQLRNARLESLLMRALVDLRLGTTSRAGGVRGWDDPPIIGEIEVALRFP